jgi:hypothetical protein
LLGAEDEGCWIDADSVIVDLVVDVVSHASSVATTSETFVSCDRLTLGHCCWHGHSVRLAVEDHDAVACELSGACDLEASVTTAAVSVRIGLSDDRASKRSVHGGPHVALHIPTGVSTTSTPGGTVVAAPVRIAQTLLVGCEG